ncbi:MAG: hypothetical protein M3209_09560 [Acidobacteriota bacterium]|nr:hypothetical protein [Acidobacteriota bacterium]
MEATQTQSTNLTENDKPKTPEEHLAEARAFLQQNALANPLEEAKDFDRRMADFIQIFHYSNVIAVSLALAIVPNTQKEHLVWEARFAFHFKPKGNVKRTMFWTRRDRETAETNLEFFLKNCGEGKLRLTRTNEALRARKDVTKEEFRRIFDPEAAV